MSRPILLVLSLALSVFCDSAFHNSAWAAKKQARKTSVKKVRRTAPPIAPLDLTLPAPLDSPQISLVSSRSCPGYPQSFVDAQPALQIAYGAHARLDCSVIAGSESLPGLNPTLSYISRFLVAFGTNDQSNAISITQHEFNQILILVGAYQLGIHDLIELRSAVKKSRFDGQDGVLQALGYILSVKAQMEELGSHAVCWWVHGVDYLETLQRIDSVVPLLNQYPGIEMISLDVLPGELFVIGQCDLHRN